MTQLRQVVTDAYQHLRQHKLVRSQYDFSKNWLGRSAGYYGYLKSSGSEPTADAVLTLLKRCNQRRQFCDDAALSRKLSPLARHVFKKQANAVSQLKDQVWDFISFEMR